MRRAEPRGHKTSLSLEAGFRLSLKEIAAQEGIAVRKLVSRLDTDRNHANLSSTIRLYVLDYYRRLAELGPTVKQKRT